MFGSYTVGKDLHFFSDLQTPGALSSTERVSLSHSLPHRGTTEYYADALRAEPAGGSEPATVMEGLAHGLPSRCVGTYP
jgi:hypothetical protein